MENIQEKLERINSDLMKVPYMNQLCKQTKLKPFYIVLCLILFCVVFVAFGFMGSTLVVQIVGVTYPCWCSILALETETLDDDKKWLTYWMIFNLFVLLDTSFQFITCHIPFYLLIKLFILIWLQNPMTEGAYQVYRKIVLPIAEKHRDTL